MHSSRHSSSTQAAASRGCGGWSGYTVSFRFRKAVESLAYSSRRGGNSYCNSSVSWRCCVLACISVRWLAYQIIGSSASCAVDWHITWPAPLCHKGPLACGIRKQAAREAVGYGLGGCVWGHICLPACRASQWGNTSLGCGVTAGNRWLGGAGAPFCGCTARKWCVLFYVVVCDHAAGPQRGPASWLRVPTVCITDTCGKCCFATLLSSSVVCLVGFFCLSLRATFCNPVPGECAAPQ